MMPRVTTVEVAAVPLETPPAAPVTPELAAPDVLSPEGVAVLTLSEAVTADVALAALPFSSSCVLPPLMTSWTVSYTHLDVYKRQVKAYLLYSNKRHYILKSQLMQINWSFVTVT